MRLGVVGTNFVTDWLLDAAKEIPTIVYILWFGFWDLRNQ